MTGSLSMTGRVLATTLTTGPRQRSNRKPLNFELEDTASLTVTQQLQTRAVAAGRHITEAEGRSSGKSCLHQQTTPVCLTATKTTITTINGTQAAPEPHSTTCRYTL
ncbi:hypothetical protein F2P81_025613 [Scophthalmus maximus]|uniref:Uncharacterized protein n=1 Tax=Scophthalmus maximus TaxID=52904 RepID=A0A6A4RU99_SCOMX|nr:hypothetical protein F2P81_025613 [Scophthalmus maximus]